MISERPRPSVRTAGRRCNGWPVSGKKIGRSPWVLTVRCDLCGRDGSTRAPTRHPERDWDFSDQEQILAEKGQRTSPRREGLRRAGGPQQISIKVMRRNNERSWLGRIARIFLRNLTGGRLAWAVPSAGKLETRIGSGYRKETYETRSDGAAKEVGVRIYTSWRKTSREIGSSLCPRSIQ
jgi:hypothetical protein